MATLTLKRPIKIALPITVKPKLTRQQKKNRRSKKTPTWVKNGVRLLRHTYPESFGKKQPLKIGIHNDLIGFFPKGLGKILGRHTHSLSYLKNTIEGAIRLDLNGAPCGIVTKEAADHAEKNYKQKRQSRMIRNLPI